MKDELLERIEQLEKEVKSLREEITSLKKIDIDEINEKLKETFNLR